VVENVVFVIIGLLGLFFGGNWLVTGAARLARSFGISTLIVGLTVIALGTSSPELLVSLSAALSDSSDIALGNVIGSNISNIGLILGMTALVFPVAVRATLIRREIPLMILATILASALTLIGREIGRVDGIIMLIALVGFNFYMYRLTVAQRDDEEFQKQAAEYDETAHEPIIAPQGRLREVFRLILGLAVLIVGAQLTVDNAVAIARELNISELAIGVTLIAVGTSLPELATSLVASLRKQNDIAIGNIVGSNIFNLLLILGATSVVNPIPVTDRIIEFELLAMLAFTFALVPITITERKISRFEAVLMLIGYVAFTVVAVVG